MSSQLVWLITDLTLAALKRGDGVIATARTRSLPKLDDLRAHGAEVLELDVTAPNEDLRQIAKRAVGFYGRIDVLVNNAGYILVGALEENTPEESFDQFNTNVFGALNVARAFLPYMREKTSGTVVFLGSLGGWRAVPNAGLYSATKYAIRGISTTLHEEISSFGLRSICFDFGYFRTSFLTSEHRSPPISRISDYATMSTAANAALEAYNGKQPGDPVKGVEVVVDVVRGEGVAKGKPFPTVLALGSDSYNVIRTSSEATLIRLDEWKAVTLSTDFDVK